MAKGGDSFASIRPQGVDKEGLARLSRLVCTKASSASYAQALRLVGVRGEGLEVKLLEVEGCGGEAKKSVNFGAGEYRAESARGVAGGFGFAGLFQS